MAITPNNVAADIQKGVFKPHIYLTNVCLAYFQNLSGFVARKVFPIVPVPVSSAHYYEFDKGDLARDNVSRKPEFWHVAPGIYGKRENFYHCEVDQVITGVDQISTLDFQRTSAPAIIDGADPLRDGQISLTGQYGVLAQHRKESAQPKLMHPYYNKAKEG